ncbi:MAG TPA: hypothetical protein VL974_11785 [Magnetospirillum sp.]|jgi:hypothetical protein|nr:hypothetical protein [Magnetospirillum sp.]
MKRLALLAALLVTPALAHEHGHEHAHGPAPAACAGLGLACATAATPFTAPDGTLWLAWSAGGQVAVARAADGSTLSAPLVVSGPPAAIDDGGEARPKVLADGKGHVWVSWTVRGDKGYVGSVWLVRSDDNGRSFGPPRALSDDPASQRFESLALVGDRLVAVWIDKRSADRAKAAGQPYAGAGLVAAWSEDGGASFGPNRIIGEQSCECCRLGLAQAADGTLALVWRQIFPGGVRDHAAATLSPQGLGPLHRVAEDGWKIDACPHHGPALAVTASGAWNVAYYTDGKVRQGLFLARAADGEHFAAPRPIGNADNQPAHPYLLAQGEIVWLVWKEFEGTQASVWAQGSVDGGANWSAPRRVAATAGASDHPLLVAVAGRPMLSWLTKAEGWLLLPVEAAP